MLEVSETFFISIITTGIAVIMATLFFCCWGKRKSAELGNTPKDKVKPVENGNEAISASAVPDQEKEDAVTENSNGSATKSSTGFEEDTAELGDFSAVSRETEILRSYRKPPPPKNRARQSRAPRAAFKSSTENLDIFSELTEENSDLGDTSLAGGEHDVCEHGTPDDSEHNEAILRPRPFSDKTDSLDSGPRREDVRSSMLADIELTLAALHASNEKTLESLNEANGKDDSNNKDDANSKYTSSRDDDTDKSTALDKTDASTVSTSSTVSTRPKSHQPQKSEELSDKELARSSLHAGSPLFKPKIGPKVSPKPPKKMFLKNTTVTEDKSKNASAFNSESQPLPLTLTMKPKSENEDPANSIIDSNETGNKTLETIPQVIISPQTPTSPVESLVLSGAENHTTDINNQASEPKVVGDNMSALSDNVEQSPENARETDGESPTDNDISGHTKSDLQSGGLQNGTIAPEKSVASTVIPSENDQIFPEQPSSDQDVTNTQLPADQQVEDENNEEIKDNDNQTKKADQPKRQDSTEDAANKGKISRIPVRAGSKSRSTPPKSEQE